MSKLTDTKDTPRLTVGGKIYSPTFISSNLHDHTFLDGLSEGVLANNDSSEFLGLFIKYSNLLAL